MDSLAEERRGEEAKRLLGNALYKESWQEVRETIIKRLEQPNVPAAEREHLNNVLVGLRDARRYLEQVMVTGTMAAMQEQRKRTARERLGERIAGYR